MWLERHMPNKCKVMFTADQLSVEDLTKWLWRSGKMLCSLGVYFTALGIAECFIPNQNRDDVIGALVFYAVGAMAFFLNFTAIYRFTAQPDESRIWFVVVSLWINICLNVAETIVFIILDPVSGTYAWFFLGAISGMGSMYVLRKLEKKLQLGEDGEGIGSGGSGLGGGGPLRERCDTDLEAPMVIERNTDDSLASVQSPMVVVKSIEYSSDAVEQEEYSPPVAVAVSVGTDGSSRDKV
jgi:hypothetical protein